MKHNELEMKLLKENLGQLWKLVISQLEKSKTALFTNDVELAHEIISLEKRVNAMELRVDGSCENYIALFNPVAIDLRLVLSIMKISVTLERIGDYATGIARHVVDRDCFEYDEQMIEVLDLEQMFETLSSMLSDSFVALNSDSTSNTGRILAKDKEVNVIYRNAMQQIAQTLEQSPQHALCGLKLMLLLRNLERVGDHCSNIVEEIVFYLEAKVLRHIGKMEE